MSYPFARHLADGPAVSQKTSLTSAQQEAYDALCSNPGTTAAELERRYNDPNMHKRLSELYRLGLADKSGKRHCKVSKRKVDTWIAKPSAK